MIDIKIEFVIGQTTLRDVEKQAFEQVYAATGHNQLHTAEILGLGMRTVNRLVREWNLHRNPAGPRTRKKDLSVAHVE